VLAPLKRDFRRTGHKLYLFTHRLILFYRPLLPLT
jgi:hypothetical protein